MPCLAPVAGPAARSGLLVSTVGQPQKNVWSGALDGVMALADQLELQAELDAGFEVYAEYLAALNGCHKHDQLRTPRAPPASPRGGLQQEAKRSRQRGYQKKQTKKRTQDKKPTTVPSRSKN